MIDNHNEDCALGGFLFEICQGRGYTIPPKSFIKSFVEFLQERKVLILADEIQTGMFRTGKLFAFQHYDIVPDMITMSKSFTNGLTPLSMLWVKKDLADPAVVTPGHTHSNFANHILGTTAALATWKYMLSQDYETSIQEKGNYLLGMLQSLCSKYDFIRCVDGLGLLLNIQFGKGNNPYKYLGKIATTLAQDNNFVYNDQPFRLILNAGGYDSEGLKLAPSLDSSHADLERLAGLLDGLFSMMDTMIKNNKIIEKNNEMYLA